MSSEQQVFIESAAELRNWFLRNYTRTESIWLVTWKKPTGKPRPSYYEIVDQLICFGWVDSLPRALDEERTMLRISPRNPKSNWSAKNKDRVDRMLQAGLMHPNGIRLIEIAKETGTWTFLDDVEQLIIPNDLANALASEPQSKFYFDRFPDSSKRGILEWIKNGKNNKYSEKTDSRNCTKSLS